jgi:hypothetical protein
MDMKQFKKAAAVLAVFSLLVGNLTGCANGQTQEAATSTPEQVAAEVTKVVGDGVNLSDPSYDFQAEYYFNDYNAKSNEDTERQDGIDTFENTDIVFKDLYYDELTYLLEQEGNYLILLGGSWCHNTRAVIGQINEFAKEYGIDTIYNFDFRLDGDTRDTHIRETAQTPELGGEDRDVSDWNYLYGELVDRYFPNLNDWVEYKEDTEDALTWYDENYDGETVAKVQVPFLFLYNKDNTTHYIPVYDENGKQTGVEQTDSAGTYPIVYGFEEMVDRDSTGVYDSTDDDGVRNYITEDYTDRLENIFRFLKDNNVQLDTYTDAEYLQDAFAADSGSHEGQLFDVFTPGEQINIQVITYRQMKWLLSQNGSAAILFGGAWCGNTAAAIGTINDYAVANNTTVYLFDLRLDGKHPVNYWGYGRDRLLYTRTTNLEGDPAELTDSTFVGQPNPFAYLYNDLINTYLTNIETITDPSADNYYITATDPEGTQSQAARMQVPYLIAYNKDAVDEDGFPAPIMAWHEEMLEITEDSKEEGDYFYQKDNYASYTAGIEEVFNAFFDSIGQSISFHPIDPRQELED